MIKKLLFSILMIFCINACYADTNSEIFIPEAAIEADNKIISDQFTIDANNYNTTHNSAYINKDHKKIFDYDQIVTSCTNEANRTTTNAFYDFDQNQYNDQNPEYKINNAKTRMWYNKFLNTFNTEWKAGLENQVKAKIITLKEYAEIAVAVRHYARVFTRNHLDDDASLEAIKARDLKKYGSPDGPTFEWLLNRQLEKQKRAFTTENPEKTFDPKSIEEGGNFKLDKAYKSIIDSSTKTNSYVNTFMRCYDYLPISFCDFSGSLFASFMDV